MAFYNQVLLNGAVRLHLAKRVDSIEEGVYTCKSLLDNGIAWANYLKWRDNALNINVANGLAKDPVNL